MYYALHRLNPWHLRLITPFVPLRGPFSLAGSCYNRQRTFRSTTPRYFSSAVLSAVQPQKHRWRSGCQFSPLHAYCIIVHEYPARVKWCCKKLFRYIPSQRRHQVLRDSRDVYRRTFRRRVPYPPYPKPQSRLQY